MSGWLAKLAEMWRRTSLVQRVLLIGVLLGCSAAAVFLVGWVGQPDMALLYSKLSGDEAAKIVEKLNDAKVPYELIEGGTTIRVPRDKVYSLRLDMASQGLPAGGQAGYELIEKQEFGASPRQIEANYIRAIEGELAKSIQIIDGVELARVRVVQPRSKIFVAGDDKGASASVMVKMRGSRRLAPTNVSAIVHLVSGGVEGLLPEKVVVVDGRGVLYTGESGEKTAHGTTGLHRYKAQVESELARKAEEVLERALGPGRAMVRVTVEVDRSQVRTKKTMYEKANQVAKKEELIERSKPVPGASQGGKDTESNISTEYFVPETVTEETELPGAITSTAVSAVVDLSAPEGSDQAPTLTEAQCKDLICTAVGITDEEKKSTSVQVVATKFNRASPLDELDGAQAGWFSQDFLLEVLRRASLGLLVVGALLALKIVGGKKKKVVAPAGAAGALPGAGAGAFEGLLPAGEAGEADPELLRASITRALQENPDEVKRLFLSWVENEKGGA